MSTTSNKICIEVKGLDACYGSTSVLKNISFTIPLNTIFTIMGPSGCGKSTLLKYLIGLKTPQQGSIQYGEHDFLAASTKQRQDILKQVGVLYQSGALWSTMTLLQNVALPLQEYTQLPMNSILELASLKLALVGLKQFEGRYPHELSGGMRKRAALARAIALDPKILFLDEPSAGLDPITSAHLDDLIVQLKDSLDMTVIMVTHELVSIFGIAEDSIFLDNETKSIVARGNPKAIAATTHNQRVKEFLTRTVT